MAALEQAALNMAENVTRLCKGSGASIRSQAQLMGIGHSSLQRMMRGSENVTVRSVAAVADHYGLSVAELLSGPEEVEADA